MRPIKYQQWCGNKSKYHTHLHTHFLRNEIIRELMKWWVQAKACNVLRQILQITLQLGNFPSRSLMHETWIIMLYTVSCHQIEIAWKICTEFRNKGKRRISLLFRKLFVPLSSLGSLYTLEGEDAMILSRLRRNRISPEVQH